MMSMVLMTCVVLDAKTDPDYPHNNAFFRTLCCRGLLLASWHGNLRAVHSAQIQLGRIGLERLCEALCLEAVEIPCGQCSRSLSCSHVLSLLHRLQRKVL